MYYSTKKITPYYKEYIVIRHPLRQVGNVWISGVKFVNGCGVVEKSSKIYRQLITNPLFKKRKELGLERLVDYGFKTKDISLIFGKDIYYSYLKAVGLNSDLTPIKSIESPEEELQASNQEEFDSDKEQETNEGIAVSREDINTLESIVKDKEEELPDLGIQEIIEAHKELDKCIFIKADGNICEGKVSKGSPSGNYCFGHIKKDPKLKKKS